MARRKAESGGVTGVLVTPLESTVALVVSALVVVLAPPDKGSNRSFSDPESSAKAFGSWVRVQRGRLLPSRERKSREPCVGFLACPMNHPPEPRDLQGLAIFHPSLHRYRRKGLKRPEAPASSR